jgi:hypothetical protein
MPDREQRRQKKEKKRKEAEGEVSAQQLSR